MWLRARLATSIRRRFDPRAINPVTSTAYGGHHTDPARRSLTYTTAASRTGASSHACMPDLSGCGATGVPSPKSSTTRAARAIASDTVTSFSYVATPEKYRVASSSVHDRSRSIVTVGPFGNVTRHAALSSVIAADDAPRVAP